MKELKETTIMGNEQKKQNRNNKFVTSKFIIVFVFIIITIILFINMFMDSKNNKKSSNEPSEIDLMSYVQTVLEDNLNNPKYSRTKNDYHFIKTNLRYKVEGQVTLNNEEQQFCMILQFVDNTYKEYDLISLQVGNRTIK